MIVPRSMLMPHVNGIRPASVGVTSMVVRSPLGRNFLIPSAGMTTSSEQLESSLRSNTRRSRSPFFARTVFGA